jgi:hypothetical protein
MSRAPLAIIADAPAIRIPAGTSTLAGFGAWALSDEFPKRGRVSFINWQYTLQAERA